ncbi:uncharacterized protein LOC115205385 isoform X2 [Salmo trutta]|uniref:uncharacterized protein LOC115205385 isoform X2 n=1 Tax=Salmo trutta TaxID=8032 RepID=UPI001131F824|nr:uncharacterized protein LOC115205385 isoform X2 [Salmo trutta]
MEAVFGLLVMIAGVSHGMLTSSCDAREDGCHCYGALGGTVYLQLTDTTVSELTFKKDPTGVPTEILRMRRNKMIIADSIKTRSEFFMNNRTFRMDNTERTDSDEYLLETFHSNGSSLANRRLHLFIEGLIYVNCTLSTGTKISGWVNATDDPQRVEATTANTVKNDINNPTVNQFHCQVTAGAIGSGFNVFVYFQLAEVFILMAICLGSYCFYKKKTCPQEQAEEYEESQVDHGGTQRRVLMS